MECPTCLQKITAPQAPGSADQKFILSGKKTEVRPRVPAPSGVEPAPVTTKQRFPPAAAALWILIVLSVTAAIVFHAQIFGPGGNQPVPAPPGNTAAHPARPPAPKLVAPPASDTNWLLALDKVDFPDCPAAGRIHGEDFISERAFLQGGSLTLRQGTRGSVEFGLIINFNGAPPEALAGKTINITTNAPLAARVTLRWKEADQVVKGNFDTGYALRLEFGPLAGNHLPGKIYFCAPDENKSYIAGKFVAEVRKAKPAKPKAPSGN